MNQESSEDELQQVSPLPGFEPGEPDPLIEARQRSEEARRIFEASEDAEPWMDDYWALLAEGWTWRQAVYMIWASQPPGRRQPKTQMELATRFLGLTSDRAIRDWKANNPAFDARIARLTASVLVKFRAEVFDALRSVAGSNNPRAHADRKMFLEMTGDYVRRQTVSLDLDDVEGASTEDLVAMAQLRGTNDDDDDGDE